MQISENPVQKTATGGEQGLDAIIIGAGFAGMYMLHKLRALGFRAVCIEAGPSVGGTWYWNRYPGARCDVPSLEYCYSFSEELEGKWQWQERYATQPEILRYANFVADELDLRHDIRLDTRVLAATWDDASARWTVTTDAGEPARVRYLISAVGCLSAAKAPEIAGLASFAGEAIHTAHWPHAPIDFTGKRVGVIGTGSSGIQAIPLIAERAGHLTVFQRTPSFSVPAHNQPIADETRHRAQDEREQFRKECREIGTAFADLDPRGALAVPPEERAGVYEARWQRGGASFMYSFADIMVDAQANETAAEFIRGKIRDIVQDPATAEALSPRDYPVGTKRICVDTAYYATFNRNNVALVDLRANPMARIEPAGVRLTDGSLVPLDILVMATGFDAMTGALDAIRIEGRDARTLRDKWAGGASAYLGLACHGFPNLFVITGPGSPSVLSNVIMSIEHHVDFIADMLGTLRDEGVAAVEPSAEAEVAWAEHVDRVAATTLYPQANSWYLGANVPGKPRRFLVYLGLADYRQRCADIAAQGYPGFERIMQKDALPLAL